jgi:hypothetical protein
MALQLMGAEGDHAAILVSLLDLPESWKWRRTFNLIEKYTDDAVEIVKVQSQHKAVDEEVLETLEDKEYIVDQNKVENEEYECSLPRIQASYGMGWQVSSFFFGNKYGSPTGHGLLIGTRSKKVFDSTVFNKHCAVCTKQNYATLGQ